MPTTWGELTTALRQALWPSGEAFNLVASHDRTFIDAIIDIQTWVECAQQDNTNLFPQCATFYNCGLTIIDSAPRGVIHKVSVIDKLNPTTGLEDANAADDWCSEIVYAQVDACHIRNYLSSCRKYGSCLPIPLFFGLACGKGYFPVPTDAGLPPGLPSLPLGFHYPQASTDRNWGRAGAGVWAMERGQIFIAPWLQTTETAVVVWDGLKRSWSSADPIDDDPLLALAIKEYVRWKHADEWDKDEGAYARARDAYEGPSGARTMLIHQCREETRVRRCEPSHARAANGLTSLFYNDAQSASASCPPGQEGSAVSVTIPAGTVASSISKADANQKARDQAQAQATQQLVCTTPAVTYTNDTQTATASCSGSYGAPPPDGAPVTVTVPAGTVTSTISKADANALALAQAQASAAAQLSCTWWNAAQTYTATCPQGESGAPVTKTVAAHTFSSVFSQADADSLAYNDAKRQAEEGLSCQTSTIFHNDQQVVTVNQWCNIARPPCLIIVTCTVAAGSFTGFSQAQANLNALNAGRSRATSYAQLQCNLNHCGNFQITYP